MFSFLAAANNPVLKMAALVVAILAFIAYQRHDAARSASAQVELDFRKEVAEAVEKEKQRRRAANERVLERAEAREQAAAERMKELEKLRDEIISESASFGDCAVPVDLIERLRAIEISPN